MAYFDHFKELAAEPNTSEKLDTCLLRMLTSDVALPMSASGKEDLPLHKVSFLHTSIIVLTLHMQLVELILFPSKTASKVFGETHEVMFQINLLRVNFNSTLTLTLTLTLTRI